MDNIEIILYKTIVYPNVKFNSNTFSKIVNNILKDKRGWENHPKAYNDKYVSFLKVQNDFNTKCLKNNCLTIHLVLDKDVQNICNFIGLSCYDPNTNHIYINFNRWMNGSKEFFRDNPNSTIKDYRIYVINHEVGHHLQRGHKKNCDKKTGKSFVMMQQTKGNVGCKSNHWPLHYE